MTTEPGQAAAAPASRVKRLSVCLAVAALALATAGSAHAGIQTSAAPMMVEATRVFSPNGDGVKDRAVVRYTLSHRSEDVTLTVSYHFGGGRVRVLRLGAQRAGEYVWRWDGRRGNGDLAEDTQYVVAVTAQYPPGPVTSTAWVTLDTTFNARVQAERYGAPRLGLSRVYPRSTEVVDALPVTAVADEPFLERARVIIRDDAGRVILHRDVKVSGRHGSEGWILDLRWKALEKGRPLPAGRYRAVLAGQDKAGNRGRSQPLWIRVSAEQLGWHEETRTVTAADTDITSIYCGLMSTANGCLDHLASFCGDVVPSDLFAGGLSHRSALCPPSPGGLGSPTVPQARSVHLLSVPEAVRGIDGTRVAFAGSPTHAGETDPGTLSLEGTTTTSASSAQSPWVEAPTYGNGRPAAYPLPRIPPSVYWAFSTAGDDAFDVATFTIDLRYLVVAEGS